MELDDLRASAMRRLDLLDVGVDEGADQDLRGDELLHDGPDADEIAGDIESTLGRDFLPVLRNEANFLGLVLERLLEHRRGGRHLEVERKGDRARDGLDVGFLNVAAVLAEMDGDGVGAGLLGDARRLEDVRFGAQAGFPIADSAPRAT